MTRFDAAENTRSSTGVLSRSGVVKPGTSALVDSGRPSCEPDTDPTRDLVELRWCPTHAPAWGGTDDLLVPFRGGVATARAIPDAEFLAIPGMGHDLPRQVWPKVVDALVATTERARSAQPA